MTLEELKKLIADDESGTVEVKETTGQCSKMAGVYPFFEGRMRLRPMFMRLG